MQLIFVLTYDLYLQYAICIHSRFLAHKLIIVEFTETFMNLCFKWLRIGPGRFVILKKLLQNHFLHYEFKNIFIFNIVESYLILLILNV